MAPFLRIHDRDIKVEGRLLRTGRIDGEKYCFLNDPEPVIEALKKSGTRVDLFTFMQRLPETAPKYKYPMEWDNFAVLPISTFDHWWKQIGPKTRNMVRLGEKRGLRTAVIPFDDVLVQGIWEIYNETPVRQGKQFPHYGMSLQQAREYAGTFLADSFFIGAFVEEKLVGFAKLTMDESRTQAGLMHILSMVAHRDKAPTNALIAAAVLACVEHSIPYLVYANFSYGNKQHDSLSDFKERNGFSRVEIPRYYVPLTPLGKAVFRLGLHHSLLNHIPEPLIAKLRELRSAWYQRKLQVSGESR